MRLSLSLHHLRSCDNEHHQRRQSASQGRPQSRQSRRTHRRRLLRRRDLPPARRSPAQPRDVRGDRRRERARAGGGHDGGNGIRMIVVPDTLLEAIARPETSQGVIALVDPPDGTVEQTVRRPSSLRLVHRRPTGSRQPRRHPPLRRSLRSHRCALSQRHRQPLQPQNPARLRRIGLSRSLCSRVWTKRRARTARQRRHLRGRAQHQRPIGSTPSDADLIGPAPSSSAAKAAASVAICETPHRLSIPTAGVESLTPPSPPPSCCTKPGGSGPGSHHESVRIRSRSRSTPTRQDAPAGRPHAPRDARRFAGQEHILGPGKPLRAQIERDAVTSIIFWGPPGVGKTTLARLIARMTRSEFLPFSAVLSGIKEIKAVMADAERLRRLGRRTIVFIDEIHRFNKAQQDAFLPYVESRRHHPHRRHHREPVVRSQRGAALALARSSCCAPLTVPKKSSNCCARAADHAAGDRDVTAADELLEQIAIILEWRRPLRLQYFRSSSRRRQRHGAHRRQSSKTLCSAKCCSTTNPAKSTTT